jgi:2-polyprenyl-3-methyl-5-hydroxy-6-metoxy-1,4-benzoquinol methylase
MTACRICGSTDLRLAFAGSTASPTGEQVAPTRHHPGEQPELHRCGHCGTLQARAVESELRAAYTEMVDEPYVAEEAARRATCRRLLAAAGRALPPRADGEPPLVLDVGCGVGLLLDEARGLGWRTHGVELSDWGVARARKLGLEVDQCTIEEARFGTDSFDAVFMIDVLEHLADPIRTLAEVARVLRPGGVLCLVTPDAGAVAARLLGARWWGMLPGHVVLLPHRTLAELLRSLGFAIRSQRPGALRFSLDYWLASASEYVPGLGVVRRALGRAGRVVVPVNLLDERVVVATKLGTGTDAPAPSRLITRLERDDAGRRATGTGD